MNPDNTIPSVMLGVPFSPIRESQALDGCLELIRLRKPATVVLLDLPRLLEAQQDPEWLRCLTHADLVLAGDRALVKLSQKLGAPLPEAIPGAGFVPKLVEAAARAGHSLFHLGASPSLAQDFETRLAAKIPGFSLPGAYAPSKTDLFQMDQTALLQQLNAATPDLLLVAFAPPRQEKWIQMHLHDWEVPLAIGIGDSLGTLARTPQLPQAAFSAGETEEKEPPKGLFQRIFQREKDLSGILRQIDGLRSGSDPAAAGPEPMPADDRVQRIRWQPLPDPASAEKLLAPLLATEASARPLLIDFSGTEWLDPLELGSLALLGRSMKKRQLPVFYTAASPKLSRWLAFNHLDTLLESVAADVDWTKRLAVKPLQELQKVIPQTAPRPSFGQPQKRSRILQDSEHHLCTFIPPDELTSLTVPEWRASVEEALADLPPDTRTLRVEAADLRFLDSAGLGTLMWLKKRAAEKQLSYEVIHLQGAPLTTVKLARVEGLLLAKTARSVIPKV